MTSEEMILRWRRAMERVLAENVRIMRIGDVYYAASSSIPLGSHRLEATVEGWICDCIANSGYGMPCKHIAALATEIEIDLLHDVRLDWTRDAVSRHAA